MSEKKDHKDSKEGGYIHGTSPEAQRRLSLLNDLLNDASLHAMRLSGGERILDVGSGLGQFTRRLAAVAGPEGYVLAVERSPVQIRRARSLDEVEDEAQVEFREGDAEALPLRDNEWGSFHIAHARFVLEHVSDPESVVRGMVRALRPGGRLVLEDDDHSVLQLFPEPSAVMELWRAYIAAFERTGSDPYVGRRLVDLIHRAGATPIRNDSLFFGSSAGNPTLGPMVENFIGVIRGAAECIAEDDDWSLDRIESVLSDFRAWSKLPNAAIWYGTFWAAGRKPS